MNLKLKSLKTYKYVPAAIYSYTRIRAIRLVKGVYFEQSCIGDASEKE